MSRVDMRPSEIRLSPDKGLLTLSWADGKKAAVEAEYLRVESPSAEVKGHGLGQARLVSGKKNVTITGLEPVGAYALKIVFSDGHNTGLYTWEYLRELVDEHSERWTAYVTDLERANLTREVAGTMVLRANLA